LLDQRKAAIAVAAARLEDLSPLAILTRGYSVCYAEDGRRVVRRVEDVDTGDRIRVRIEDGSLGCLVESAERLTTHDRHPEQMES